MLLSFVVLSAEVTRDFQQPTVAATPPLRLQIVTGRWEKRHNIYQYITSLCPKKKTSHPRSRCKSWRCGPRPWIYPLCWQPLIEPRLIRLMDDLETEFLKVGAVSRWEDVFTCFAMIAVFVVRKVWSQWAVISIWCLFVFFYMSFCTHSSNLSCYCPAMVLQPAGISTKPATNLCMLWPCMTWPLYTTY